MLRDRAADVCASSAPCSYAGPGLIARCEGQRLGSTCAFPDPGEPRGSKFAGGASRLRVCEVFW